jgi:hypothetical protein
VLLKTEFFCDSIASQFVNSQETEICFTWFMITHWWFCMWDTANKCTYRCVNLLYYKWPKHVGDYTVYNTRWSKSLCAPDEQSPHNWWVEDGHHRIHVECGPCYTEHGLREHSSGCQQMSGDWRGTLWTLLVTFCIVIIRCTENFWSSCTIIYIPIYALIGCTSHNKQKSALTGQALKLEAESSSKMPELLNSWHGIPYPRMTGHSAMK